MGCDADDSVPMAIRLGYLPRPGLCKDSPRQFRQVSVPSPFCPQARCIKLITARIRRMGKVMFSVCSHLGGGGGGGQVKGQSSRGGGQVQPAGEGVGGWVSILRPLAGGMPLAFTQEDFLVCGVYIFIR